jgi:hypothetical protein
MWKAVHRLYYITLSTYFGPFRAIFRGTTAKYTLCRFIALSNTDVPMPVTARSKAWVCGISHAEVAGSNPARGCEVVSVVCFQVEVSASS